MAKNGQSQILTAMNYLSCATGPDLQRSVETGVTPLPATKVKPLALRDNGIIQHIFDVSGNLPCSFCQNSSHAQSASRPKSTPVTVHSKSIPSVPKRVSAHFEKRRTG